MIRCLLALALIPPLCWVEAASSHPALDAGQMLLGKDEWQFDADTDVSSISCTGGHYPPPFCTATNIALNHETKHFTVYAEDADIDFANKYLFRVAADKRSNFPKCDQTISDVAYLFTFFFFHGTSNYFHLHKDTLFPMYMLLREKARDSDAKARRRPVVLMPVVELRRMAEIDWNSGAFDEQYLDKYFILVLKALAGDEHAILPLDSNLVKTSPKGFTCFRKAFIGAPSLKDVQGDSLFMKSFVNFMMKRLAVKRGEPSRARVGLIKRGGRRKILNEDELVAAVRGFVDVDLVEFNGLSFKEQLEAIQQYTVLVGMNGAGFMNAIYLPEGAVSVQLAPYNATMLNTEEFGQTVSARGPYLFWRNAHPENHHPIVHDTYNSQANTVVHIDEFVALVKRALKLGVNEKLWNEGATKTEL